MKRIRNRARPDRLKSDVRTARKSWGRHIYMFLLAVIAFVILDYFFGSYLVFRADGVVLRQKVSSDSAFVSQIISVRVKPGQTVQKGEILAQINSVNVRSRIADLSLQLLSHKQRRYELFAQIGSENLKLRFARETLLQKRRIISRLEALSKKGLRRSDVWETAIEEETLTRKALDDAQANLRSLKHQEAEFGNNLREAQNAFDDLNHAFSDGIIRAATSGEIGAAVRSPGEVLLVGENFLNIYTGPAYVLAYLPRNYLRKVKTGMQVLVSADQHEITGKIVQVLPESEALPREFTNSVRAPGRNQLAVIHFKDPFPAPLQHRVRVTAANTRFDRISRWFSGWLDIAFQG